jgi:hypothetical protein
MKIRGCLQNNESAFAENIGLNKPVPLLFFVVYTKKIALYLNKLRLNFWK